MAMGRINFGITDLALIGNQGLHHFTAAGGGKTPVGGEADQQKLGAGMRQGLRELALEGACWIKIIQSTGDQQLGVGVKVLAELVALIP